MEPGSTTRTGAPAPVVVFSHGWPLSSDSWEAQMLLLAANGCRCIAHDRRGHGRSSQPWDGNEMDTYADDLAALMDALDLTKATLIGFSTGGGEVARYIGRHGTERVARAALVSAVPPLMLKTAANPGGLPIDVFDGIRKARSRIARSSTRISPPGRSSAPTVRARRSRRACRTRSGARACSPVTRTRYDCIKAFSETDFTKDLEKFDVPTLVIHGDDDQIVPIDAAGLTSAKLVKGATLKVYPGAPHGITDTHKDQLSADLLAFVKG